MLKNKIIVRKIRNILILLMAIIIMVGAYKNIGDSRAEDVIEIEAIAIDNYGYLANELFILEAMEIDNDTYEIQLPESVNGKEINQIVKVTLEEPTTEVESEGAVQENASTENTVETLTDETTTTENATAETSVEQTPTEETPVEQAPTEETPAEENPATSDENEEQVPETPVEEAPVVQTPPEENTTTPETAPETTSEENSIEIIDNKITLTKEQIENKQLNIEVVYYVAILETNEQGELIKNLLSGAGVTEENNEVEIAEGAEILYSKILKYEDEENGKLVEVKGYLPKDTELKVEEVPQEQLVEIFGEKPIDVAYDIKLVIHVTKEILIDETDPSKGTTEIIETIEVNPEEFGETCQVLIKDANIQTESQVYHVKEDNTYEKVNVKENTKENITFDAQTFSIYAVTNDEDIMLAFDLNYIELYPESETSNSTINVDINHILNTQFSVDYAWSTSTSESTASSSKVSVSYMDYEYSFSQSTEGKWYLHLWFDGSEHTYSGPYWIDKTRPTVPTVTGGNAWTNASSQTLTLSATDPGTYPTGVSYYTWQYADGSESGTCDSSAIFYAEQKKTVYFYAVDAAGNKSSTYATGYTRIDRTAPTDLAVSNSSSGNWTNQNVTLTASATDNLSGVAKYQWSSNNSTWNDMSGNTVTFTETMNSTIYVRAVDYAGNTSSTVSTAVKIDKIAPTTTVTTSATLVNGVYYTNQPTVTIYFSNITDTGGSGFREVAEINGWNGTTWVSTNKLGTVNYDSTNNRYYSTFTFSELPNTSTGATNQGEGTYTFDAHIYDNANNKDTGSTKVTVVYDTTAPTATGISLSTTYTNTGKITATAEGVQDNLSGVRDVCWYVMNSSGSYIMSGNGSDGQWYKSIDISSQPEGWYNVGIILIDNTGNQNDTTWSGNSISYIGRKEFCYDRTEPLITLKSGVNIVTEGLIRHYDGTNNTGNGHSNSATTWKDLSGNYDAIVNGGTFSDNYLSLDGINDWANLGSVNVTNAVTLEATIELKSIQSGSATIMGNLSSGGMKIDLYNGKPRFWAYINGTKSISSLDAFEPGKTYHILGMFDGSKLKLYVDGELVAQSSTDYSGQVIGAPTNGQVMQIGSENAGTSNFANINVYGAKIYNRALTEEEIYKNVIASGTTDTNTNLIRYFNGLNNTGSGHSNSATTWKDLSGNSDGTVVGATFYDNYLSFDGVDDYVQSGSIDDLSSNVVTVDTTIELKSIQSGEIEVISYTEGGGFALELVDGKPRFQVYLTGQEYKRASLQEALAINTKYRITGIYDGASVKLYVNGELKVETAATGTIQAPYGTPRLVIGAEMGHDTDITGYYANINVYEAKIYDRALTQAEIYQNMIEQNTGSTTSSETWAQKHTVTVILSDNYSGIASGASIKYGWSTSTTTAPSSYTTATLSYSAGDTISSFKATTDGLVTTSGKYYLWVVPETYKDVAGNSSTTTVKSTGTYWVDITAPTITLGVNSYTTWSKTIGVTVRITDAHSGLATGGSVKYGWAKLNDDGTVTAPSSYTTKSLANSSGASSTSFSASASGLTGKYYLWVVPTTLKDVVGNSQTSTTKSTGTFYFDNTQPTIILGSDENTTWAQNHTVTVTLADEHSGLAAGSSQSIKYCWISQDDGAATNYKTVSLSNSAGVSSVSFTATTEGLVTETGKYYLWVDARTYKDLAGNSNSSYYERSTGEFYIDLTKPRIDIGETEKVTDGLIRHYSATNNTGSGYNASATTWKDLTGNYDATLPSSGASFESDYLLLNGGDTKTLNVGDIGTLSEGFTIETKMYFSDLLELGINADWFVYPAYFGYSCYMDEFLGHESYYESEMALPCGCDYWIGTYVYSLELNDLVTFSLVWDEQAHSYRAYINGMIVGKDTNRSDDCDGSNTTTSFGELLYYSYSTSTEAKINDIKVYNRPLSQDEIFQNMQSEESTETTNENEVWKQTHTVTVNLSDIHSGLAAGTSQSIKYGWSTSTTTAPSNYKTVSLSNSAGVETATFEATTDELVTTSGKYYLWVVPETYKDVAGNSNTTTVKSEETYWVDITAPTISINPQEREVWAKTHSAEISITDAHSGLATGAQIQYQWVKQNDDGTAGTVASNGWSSTITLTGYTAGTNSAAKTTITTSDLRGKYQLYIKPVSVKDVVGNSQTSNTISTGTFWFDYINPTITITPEQNTTYSKVHTATVTIADEHCGLATGNSVKYGWSTSNTTAPSSYKTVSLSNLSGASSVTFEATTDGLVTTSGKYYLWVAPITLKDIVGNTLTDTAKSSGTFYIDLDKPTLTVNPSSSDWKNSAVSVTVTHNDTGGSGVASTSGSYFLSTSTEPTTVPTGTSVSGTYTSGTAFSINPGTTGQYYLYVKQISDNATNTSSTTNQVTISSVTYHRYGLYKFDYAKPTITVNTTSATWRNSALSLTITAADTGGSGLSSSNSYQWYLSNSSTSLTTGDWTGDTWTTYTSETAFSINPGVSGTYYLFIKRISDNAGNVSTSNGTDQAVSTVTYHRYGTYQFDYDKPTLTVSPSSCDWRNSSLSITITHNDTGGSGVASTSGQYFLTTSSSPTSTGTLSNYTSGTAFSINPAEGQYYLFVKQITDKATNISNTTDQVTISGVKYHRYGLYKFDKTVPTITVNPSSADWRNSALSVTITHNDTGGSGISSTSGQYFLTTSSSPTSTGTLSNYTSGTAFSINPAEGQYYLFVKQISDNATNKSSTTNYVTISGVTYHRYGLYKFDKTAPTLTVNPSSADWRNSALNITITHNDTGGSEVASSSGQYFLTTSSSPTSTGTLSNYTSGTAFSINPAEGQYYLFVKQISDNATNKSSTTNYVTISGVTYHRYGLYKFDKTAPTLTVSPTSSDWKNSAVSVTVTHNDTGGSGLSSTSGEYFLSTSTSPTTKPTGTSVSGTYTDGTAFNINPGTTGQYYLFVKQVSDNATNTSSTTNQVTISGVTYHRYGLYKFDYDKPIWSYVSKDIYYSTANDAGNDDYANRERTVKITFKGTDAHSGIDESTLTSNNITVSVNGTAVANSNKSLTTSYDATTNEPTCTLTIENITGDGTLNVVIPSGTLKDNASNTNDQKTLTTDVNIEIDNTSPTLSFDVTSPTAGYYKAGQVITITATYNENIYKEITSNNLIDTTNEAPAMALTFGGAAAKGTVSCSSVSGNVITYTYTIQGATNTEGTNGDNGTLVVSSLGTVYDAAGNAISASNVTPSVSIVADTIAPTLTITADKTSPTNASSITYTFTFSEGVTGFTADDVTVTNGTKSTFTATSSSVYTLVVTNSGSCTQTVSVAADKCIDRAGNGNKAATGVSIEIDRDNPTLTVNPSSTTEPDWRNSALSVTITATDPTVNGVTSGLSTSNEYKYFLSTSTSPTAVPTDAALSGTYTSGTAFNINPGTSGQYYLYVKQISDKATNTSSTANQVTIGGVIYHRYGLYKFDYDQPIATGITLSKIYTNTGIITATAEGVEDIGGSGMSQVRWFVINSSGTRIIENVTSDGQWYKEIDISAQPEGWYKVGIVLHDNAGNKNDTTDGAWQVSDSYIGWIDFCYDKTAPTAPTTMEYVFGNWDRYTQGTWANESVYAAYADGNYGPSGATDTLSGVEKYQISEDNSTWVDYEYDGTDPMYGFATEGIHTRYFRAVDYAGNAGPSIDRKAQIDLTLPTLTVSPTSSDWKNSAVSVTITAEDTGGSELSESNAYEYFLSTEASPTAVATGSTVSGTYTSGTPFEINPGTSGEYYLYVRQISDNATNGSSTANQVTIDGVTYHRYGLYKFDYIKPTGTISTDGITMTKEPTITIYFTDVDDTGGSGLNESFIIGYGQFGDWVSEHKRAVMTYDSVNDRYYTTFTFSELPDSSTGETNNGSGTYTFEGYVYDNAGNYKHVGVESVIYDITNPEPGTLDMKLGDSTGEDYTEDTWTNQSIYIAKVDGLDEHSGHQSTTYTVKKDGVIYSDLSDQTEPTTLTETGVYEITVTTTDNVGNTATNSHTYKVKIDKEQPIATGITLSTIYTNTGIITATANGVEDIGGSGMNGLGVRWHVKNSSGTTIVNGVSSNGEWYKSIDISAQPEGWYKVGIVLYDNAGNKNDTTASIWVSDSYLGWIDFCYDKTAPTWTTENINIDKTNKEVTVDLVGTDELSGYASNSLDTGDITVKVDGETASSVTKDLGTATYYKEDGTVTTNESEAVKVKYTLTLSGLEQSLLQDGKIFKEWSGSVSIDVAAGSLTDKAGNTNIADSYSLGHADFIKPVIELVSANNGTTTQTIVFNVIDKYLDTTDANAAVKEDEIIVYIDGVEVSGITKTIKSKTNLTATVNGDSTHIVGQQYTLELSGFTQDDWSGTVSVLVKANAAEDTSDNTNIATTLFGKHKDEVKPVIEKVSSTKDPSAKTETIVFNVLDKYLDTDENDDGVEDDSIISTNEIKVYVDDVEVTNEITKTITKVQNFTETVNGDSTHVVGQQYQVVLSGFEKTRSIAYNQYTEYSGTVRIEIVAGAVKDIVKDGSGGNTNDLTPIAGDFVDFIKPDVNYIYATSDINKTDKYFIMQFELVDKYFTNSSLPNDPAIKNHPTIDYESTIAEYLEYLEIYIDGEDVTENSNVTKEIISVTDVTTTGAINKTVSGTVQSVSNALIGKRYTLKLSNLEQNPNNGLDYSGVVSVAIKSNTVTDTSENGNLVDTTTIKTGNLPSGGLPEDGTVDVVDPVWVQAEDPIVKPSQQTATITVKATDKFYDSNSFDETDITVLVNGAVTTDGITVQVVKDTSVTVENGEQYKVTVTGFPVTAYSLKIVINEDAITDKSGNTSKEQQFVLYTTLMETADETEATSLFLDNPYGIQRQYVEQIIFMETVEGTAATRWDVSAVQDETIMAWYETRTVSGKTLYTVYIGSHVIMNANLNSSYLFSYIGYDSSCKVTGDTTDNPLIKNLEFLRMDNVIYMTYMFYTTGYSNMKSLDLGSNFNTENVKNMTAMFWNCGWSAMTTIDLGDKFDTSSVNHMASMFRECGYTAMTSLDLGDKFDTSNAINMYGMFQDCGYTAMTSLDLSSGTDSTNTTQFNTSSVTNMDYMFEGCGYTAMQTLNLGNKFDTSSVTNMSYMFAYCGYTAMTSLDLSSGTATTNTTQFNTSSVTSMGYMFYKCGYTAMTSLNLGNNFDTSNVESMHTMFKECGYTAMTSLDLGDKFDTSSVTYMGAMFMNCGYTAMTKLDLGDKFDTSNVTNMSWMFAECGYKALTSLDLGDKFYVSQVTNMFAMFRSCGHTVMTTLDLGPHFTKIPTGTFVDGEYTHNVYDSFITAAGKSGCVIYAPESIYKNKNAFKLSSTDATETPTGLAYTPGTINPIYKPEWTHSSTLDATNKELDITLKGSAYKTQTIDSNVKINYASNVTSTLDISDIQVFINGVDVTSLTNPAKALSTGTTSTNATSGKTEVTHTLTLLNFEEAVRQTDASGKVLKFDEWSGNVSIKIKGRGQATSTYSAKVLTDTYGNQYMMATDETGTWIDIEFKDGEIVENTNGKMFTDFIKPEFTYEYSETTIGDGNHGDTKILTVIFYAADKYFDAANSSLALSDLTFIVDGQTVNINVTGNSLTPEALADGTGTKYTLVVKNLEQNPNDGFNYSGTVSITIPPNKFVDYSENKNDAKTIIIGKDDPTTGDGHDSAAIVDVVDPVWKVKDGTLSVTTVSGKTTATMTLVATDKYFLESTLKEREDEIEVLVAGVDISDIAPDVEITLSDPTTVTNGVEYTFTVANLEETDATFFAERAKYATNTSTGRVYREFSGPTQILIPENTAKDQYGNLSEEFIVDLGTIDTLKPEVIKVSSQAVKDATNVENSKHIVVFDIVDKYLSTSAISTTDTSKIHVLLDGEEATTVTKTITNIQELRATVGTNTNQLVGYRYTLELSNFENPRTSVNFNREFTDWSGDLSIKIDANTAKDASGTWNAETILTGNENTTTKDFVDYVKPDVTYQYTDSTQAVPGDINYSDKTFTMVFDITDKHFTNSTLAIGDLEILIDGEEPDWTKVSKSLAITDRKNTVNSVADTVIGKRYTLTLSHLEQLQILSGDKYLDYSGVVTVAIPAGKATDSEGNSNDATTITSGIDIPGGVAGDSQIVDVVDPLWEKVSTSANAIDQTATITVRGTDKFFNPDNTDASTLTADEIEIYVNGAKQSITPTVTLKEELEEQRVVSGVSSSVQYGVEYTITITGFAKDVNQVKIKILEDAITDQSGNGNKATEIIAYNCLEVTNLGTDATSGELTDAFKASGFLDGNNETGIARQDIEKVVFVSSIDGATASGVAKVWDVSAQNDGSIKAWTSQTSAPYTVYIGSDYEIFANRISAGLFAAIGYSETCRDTETISGLNLLNTSSVTNMDYMFASFGYNAMTSLNLGEFDTSNVTNMTCMFFRCGHTAMTSLNLGTEFDTRNVMYMGSMLNSCGYMAMTELNIGTNFNTGRALNMQRMFAFCGYMSLEELDLSSGTVATNTTQFNTSNVTTMAYMFTYCGYTAMTDLNLGTNFNTSSVTDMSYMFDHCGYTAMTSLDLSSGTNATNTTQFNTSSVTNMESMFSNCGYGSTKENADGTITVIGMTVLNLGNNFDTSSVTNMHSMFMQCGWRKMTKLDLGDKFDTSNVTNMTNMFRNCGWSAMTNLDLGDEFDTSNVEHMGYMFAWCGSKMTSLDLGDKFDTTKVQGMGYMFAGCGAGTMINLDLGPAFTNIPSINGNMFDDCGTSSLKIYAPEAIYSDMTSFK